MFISCLSRQILTFLPYRAFVHLSVYIFLQSKTATFTAGFSLIHKKIKMLYYNINKKVITVTV